MDIRTQANDHDPKRVSVLVLQADTFEEERILTALVQAITLGGNITTETPVGDGNSRFLDFNFKPIGNKRRKNG